MPALLQKHGTEKDEKSDYPPAACKRRFFSNLVIAVPSQISCRNLIYAINHDSSVHVNGVTVCQKNCNSHATPLWTGVESAGQSDISAWESCSFDISALMWTPSLSPQVWVESRGLRAIERGGVVKDERAWGSYPCVSGGFPGRTSLSVCNCNYGRSRALCLIILHNVHLKQYLHMSVQFNIWVTPSSQLQNTPQHGSSGQPIMQHVTKVVGSILEHRTIIKGKKNEFSETSDERNALTIQNVIFNHHYILISPRGHKSLKARPLFILKELSEWGRCKLLILH